MIMGMNTIPEDKAIASLERIYRAKLEEITDLKPFLEKIGQWDGEMAERADYYKKMVERYQRIMNPEPEKDGEEGEAEDGAETTES